MAAVVRLNLDDGTRPQNVNHVAVELGLDYIARRA
jgi:hypothetical protein